MQNESITYRQRLRRIIYFFPVQLFVLHIKKNHLLLLFWLILFGFITQSIANKYGVGALFLYPEYLGEVNFLSYAIVGFALGGFVMAFNIYTYIIHAHRFPFLATLSRPFYKFSLNNFIIPLAFIICYFLHSYEFQKTQEFQSIGQILFNLSGFLSGFIFYVFLSFAYFFRTNKDIFKISGKSEEDFEKEYRKKQKSVRQKKDWIDQIENEGKWKVLTYIKSLTSINLARQGVHYDRQLLKKVFLQNHTNASIFEILAVISFLIIGIFRGIEFFQIPASASALLLFTIYLMVLSIFLSWMRGWTLTALVAIFLVINFISGKEEVFGVENQLYGLNYEIEKTPYTSEHVKAIYQQTELGNSDRQIGIEILENWKEKVQKDSLDKPKLVMINCSGGGLRATLWTYGVLESIKKQSPDHFWKKSFMINGSSGGSMGAAFWRELQMQDISNELHEQNVCKDILNPLLIDIATYDMFLRYQNIDYKGKYYTRDRAYSFEQRFNENTYGILDKAISSYRAKEYAAQIPLMVFSPTIVNDGKRLLISNFPMSYMNGVNRNKGSEIDHIELSRLLPQAEADSIRFLSVLRANATFPYILPQVSLPTEPSITLMDSGIRDNFGFSNCYLFLNAFRDWIDENTSGVVILQIRDTIEDQEDDKFNKDNTLLTRITSPLGNVYGNFIEIHDYTHGQFMESLQSSFAIPVIEHTVELDSQNKNISLSWHLNSREKKEVLDQVQSFETQEMIRAFIAEIEY
ncbi:MAG: hypothetical protein AAF487_06085 [Bacteroidota bacterium]